MNLILHPQQPPRDRWLDRLPAVLERTPRRVLVLLCLALWLPGFFALPASDRDEARFAQATRQMLDSGDFVRIRFGAEERNKKPAGIHWAQAAAVRAVELAHLGTRADIWPYRLPSLAGGLIAVLATFQLGRGMIGRRAAFVAAAMLAASVLLTVEVHIAKTDAALLGAVTVAMGLFGKAYLRPQGFVAPDAAGFWLALGIGVLLKGPIAPLIPLLAGVTLAVADREAPWLRALRPGWGLPLMLAAALPWFVAIGLATEGRFFAEAVGGDMLAKVGSGEEKHWGPPGLYLAIFFVTAFPGAWVVTSALPAAWRDRLNPPTRFLLAWIVPNWLLFEAVQTKLPHYVLPMFPALMLLGAAWAMNPLRLRAPAWLRWAGLAGLGAVAAAFAIGAAGLPWLLIRDQLPGGWLSWGLLALPAAALLLWLVPQRTGRGDWGRAALLGALAAVPLYAVVLQGVLPRLSPIWLAPRLAALLAERAPGLAPANFGIAGLAEPSLLFSIGTDIRLLANGAEAAAFLAGDRRRVVGVTDRSEPAFRAAAAGRGLALRDLGLMQGLNYTNGRQLAVTLFRLD